MLKNQILVLASGFLILSLTEGRSTFAQSLDDRITNAIKAEAGGSLSESPPTVERKKSKVAMPNSQAASVAPKAATEARNIKKALSSKGKTADRKSKVARASRHWIPPKH